MSIAHGVLRFRDVRLVAGAVGVSAFGDWVAFVALALMIEEMTGSGLAVSALFICLWSPVVVLAGHVGVLVDRVETTRLLALVSVAQAGVATALVVVDSLVPVLVLAACLGVGFAIAQACEFALIPAVTPDERVAEVNGTVETARYAGFIAGPALGGLLTALGGASLAMAINALTFVAVAVVSVSLHARRRPASRNAGERLRARDGFMTLFSTRELAVAMTVAGVSLLFMSASIPADIFFVKDVLGHGDLAYGLVLTAWTAGMILGAIALAKRIPAAALAAVACLAVTVQGAGKAAAALWLVFPFMVACYFVGGLGHGVKNVAFRTLVHRTVPPERHGRAFAAYNGLRNGAEIVALLAGGVLVTIAGSRGTLLLAGGVSALAGLAGLVTLRRARSVAEPAMREPPGSGASTIGPP